MSKLADLAESEGMNIAQRQNREGVQGCSCTDSQPGVLELISVLAEGRFKYDGAGFYCYI